MVAAIDQTSVAMLPLLSSLSISGADHGTLIPITALESDSLRVEAMPKSESTGCP